MVSPSSEEYVLPIDCDVSSVLMFGFNQEVYEVNEEDGSVNVNVIFTYGIPGEFHPSVTLTTINGTAAGYINMYTFMCR